MSTDVDVQIFGDTEVIALLEEMQAKAKNLRPALLKFSTVLRQANRARFQTEGHGTWAPLSPPYATWKIANFGPKTILRRTDELFQSLTSRPMDVEHITPTRRIGGMTIGEWGTDVEHARYHLEGTRTMPARPPIEWTPTLERELHRLVGDHITGGLV